MQSDIQTRKSLPAYDNLTTKPLFYSMNCYSVSISCYETLTLRTNKKIPDPTICIKTTTTETIVCNQNKKKLRFLSFLRRSKK